jgi:hypothetical protein
MNATIEKIIDQMQGDGSCGMLIEFGSTNWRSTVPSKPGWYLIRTNAPIEALRNIEVKEENEKHYRIGQRVQKLEKSGLEDLLIKQVGKQPWIVYNGYAKNLNSRAREHENGHPKTACLAIGQHPSLIGYQWWFDYFTVSEMAPGLVDHPILRKLVEQGWRGRHGWPVLCGA